jgi:hypothetical protein
MSEGGSDTHQLHFVEAMGFAGLNPSYKLTTKPAQVICPSGCLSTGVSSLISGFPKNISVPTHPKSDLELSHPTPQEGRIMIVTDAGRDAVDAAALARDGIAGQVDEACERSPGEQTNNTDAYGKIVWS